MIEHGQKTEGRGQRTDGGWQIRGVRAIGGIKMGLTYAKMKIRKAYGSKKWIEERLLVDSGAIYTVIPSEKLSKLGIVAHSEEEFELADGEGIKRKVGDAHYEYKGRKGAAPVVFGEKGDSKLLGILTIEALGLVLDPLRRELKPLEKRLV